MSPVVPSMADRDGKIWMDGQMVDWRDAKIHVLTHTLHYGCGAFEGVRAYNTVNGPAIFRLQEHTERLFNSAKILRMKIPFSQEEVNEAQKAVIRENKLESGYIRPLTWVGDKKLGVSPKGNTIHLMVAAWAWGAYLGEEGMKRGIRVKTSSYTRHHVNITMTQAKAVSNYTNSILANMEATDEGYDEALLLLYARSVGWRSQRHHPQHHLPHRQGPGSGDCAKAHHARRGVHRRRSLLHWHRRRSHPHPRAGSHRAGQGRLRGQPWPHHRKNPNCVL